MTSKTLGWILCGCLGCGELAEPVGTARLAVDSDAGDAAASDAGSCSCPPGPPGPPGSIEGCAFNASLGVIDCTPNALASSWLRLGSAPAAQQGLVRVPWQAPVLYGRSRDGTADVPILRWGIAGGADEFLYMGRGTAAPGQKATQAVVIDAAEDVVLQNRSATILRVGFHGGGYGTGLLLYKGRVQFTNNWDASVLFYHEVSVVGAGRTMYLLAQASKDLPVAKGGALALMGGPAFSTTVGGSAYPGDVRIAGGNRGVAVEGNVVINMKTFPGSAPGVPNFPVDINVDGHPPIASTGESSGMKGGIELGCAAVAPTAPPPVGAVYLYPDPNNSCRLTIWNHGDSGPHAL